MEKRTLVVGPSNDQFMVVEDGIAEGERVILNPRAVVDEAKQLVLEPPSQPSADEEVEEHRSDDTEEVESTSVGRVEGQSRLS